MYAGRPATLLVWFECATCGRIDKPVHEFPYPAGWWHAAIRVVPVWAVLAAGKATYAAASLPRNC